MSVTPEERERLRDLQQRWEDVMEHGSAFDFAVFEIQKYVERNWSDESLIKTWSGGCGPSGYWYTWHRGKFIVTEWRHEQCKHVFSVAKLIAEARRRIQHKPQQLTLF